MALERGAALVKYSPNLVPFYFCQLCCKLPPLSNLKGKHYPISTLEPWFLASWFNHSRLRFDLWFGPKEILNSITFVKPLKHLKHPDSPPWINLTVCKRHTLNTNEVWNCNRKNKARKCAEITETFISNYLKGRYLEHITGSRFVTL